MKHLILALVLCTVLANREADWVDPADLPLDFHVTSFFAGYLNVNSDKDFYYTYHPSQNNPTKDPVVLWVGSGPGCSALYSMMYSKGPYTFTPGTETLRANPFNWNKEVNILFMESPALTGFSTGPLKSSDYELADDNLKAIVSFFRKFEDLKDQDFFIAGEGYSGVIVPFLASRILEYNQSPFTPPYERIRLRGLFLGNPCTHPSQCYAQTHSKYSYQYLANHYYYTHDQFIEYQSQCMSIVQPGCDAVKRKLDDFFNSTKTDRRNIYKKCIKQDTGSYPNIPCLDQIGILKWFNNPQVRKAIHTNVSDSQQWTICNDIIPQAYIKDSRQAYWLYPTLIRANLRIMIYSGVFDATTPVTGTMKWIEELREELGLATTKPWTSWSLRDINGGDVWELRGITVATVRSAGHMVFTDEPELGYYLFDSFVKNRKL